MFETSFLLWLKTILVNILLPMIPGILFLWICFGKKFQGMLLYILGRFIGVGVVAFSLFNLQFIHFGIWGKEYIIILILLLIIFAAKLLYKKLSLKDYIKTLKIKNIYSDIKHSFNDLSKIEKIFTVIISILSFGFILTTFIHTTNFPTYADDSFGNWNGPAYNIYQDGGVKLFWEKTEILGRGRLWYPIYIPIYKALISTVNWWFNDIYINFWQRLVFFGTLLFVFTITFEKTKNIFYSTLPIGLIISLPLVFFHASEGYMELASTAYSILTIRALWKFLENKDYSYVSLGLLIGFILSHIKNDGLLWYFAGIIICFIWYLLFAKQFSSAITWLIKDKKALLTSIFNFLFFLFPFLIIRAINNLWFNPVSSWWLPSSQVPHREIFSIFPSIFINMDNYNIILVVIWLMIRFLYDKKEKYNNYFLLGSGIIILIIFIAVFLLTENYLWVMNQTTVNRVFTMSFIIILSFSWILLHKDNNG